MNTNISLATSAMLVEVSVSCWTAKKLSRKESDELTEGKKAAKRAAQVHKNLLADDPRLTNIQKYASDIRNWITYVTVPWNDTGTRLVSTKQFMDFKKQLDVRKAIFENMVADFVHMYPTLISAQAFKLGDMFDREEYPSPNEVASRFGVLYSFSPVPEAGDFRVDVAKDIRDALESEYASEYAKRVEAINREHWARLKDMLDRISGNLGKGDDGKNRIFRDSMVNGALELCDLLRDMNVTNDPDLEQARKDLHNAIMHVTPDELRKNEDIRADVKSQVDAILGKFQW
jgi:hypothetical protein